MYFCFWYASFTFKLLENQALYNRVITQNKDNKMLELNLPRFEVKIKRKDKIYIWDQIRKKYLVLTPEEWVRQHFVNYLIVQKRYPASLLSNELEINLNNQKRRCDTVVYNNQLQPICIVEYKAPSVSITQKVIDQIICYNIVLKVQYLIISNGLIHYCLRINFEDLSYSYLDDVPDYIDLISIEK